MEKQMNEVEKYLEEKLAEEQNKKLELSKEKETKQKKSRKGLIVAIVALILAAAAAITCAIGLKKKKNNTDEVVPETSITVGVDDLGKEEEIIEEVVNNQYGEVTGDLKKEELVEKDEVIWKDQEAADKSEEVGKVETDLQDGSLEVDNEKDVVETTPSYEVKDEAGKVVEEGKNETGIPEGYAFDEVLNKIVPVEEVGKYVCIDTDYYTSDGLALFQKGDIVLKETFTRMQEQLTTVKPEIKVEEPTDEPEQEPEKEETEVVPEITMPNGKVNRDGTYTITYEIDGEETSITYMDKATYEEWLVDEYSSDNFGFYDGIIYPVEVIEEISRQNRR